jgi:hypothetical protein
MINWKEFERKGLWPDQGTVLAVAWRDWGITTCILGQDGWYPSQVSNWAPPKYELRAWPLCQPIQWKCDLGASIDACTLTNDNYSYQPLIVETEMVSETMDFCSRLALQIAQGDCIMIIIFWEMTPCGSYKNRRFGGLYRLHLQGARVRAGYRAKL